MIINNKKYELKTTLKVFGMECLYNADNFFIAFFWLGGMKAALMLHKEIQNSGLPQGMEFFALMASLVIVLQFLLISSKLFRGWRNLEKRDFVFITREQAKDVLKTFKEEEKGDEDNEVTSIGVWGKRQ